LYRDNVSPSDESEVFRLPPGDVTYSLTEQEAFLAMTLFVAQFASRAGDDLATLMADISTWSDGKPTDPAAWDDWLNCVRAVKGEPSEGDTWVRMGQPQIDR
jgi:hypothetical protein